MAKETMTAAEYRAMIGRETPKKAAGATKAPKGDKGVARKPKGPQRGPKGPQRDIFTETCRRELGIEVVKEYQFHPTRRWRFDYAVPSRKVALEVEGGAWTGGRHTRAKGFIADMEKYNTAALFGWRVLRVVPDDLLSSTTLQMLRAATS